MLEAFSEGDAFSVLLFLQHGRHIKMIIQNLSAIILQDKSVDTKKATASHSKNKKA